MREVGSLLRTCSATDRHKREQKFMSFWIRKWQTSLIEKLETHAQKKMHHPAKSFRGPQNLHLGQFVKVFLCRIPVHKDRKEAVFQMCELQHKVMNHMKKQGNMAPKRHKINLLKTVLKKWKYMNHLTKNWKENTLKLKKTMHEQNEILTKI